MTTTTQDAPAVARHNMERLDARDLDGVLADAAPGCHWYGFAPVPLDADGYRAFMQSFLDAFPDSRFPVTEWIAEGDTVCAVHRLQGTHQAPLLGIPATGRAVTVDAAAIYHISEGRMTEVRLFADFLGLMQQLGAVPAAG